MNSPTPPSTRCGARLSWSAEFEGSGLAYLARCPGCGTLHAAGILPAPAASQNWCGCQLTPIETVCQPVAPLGNGWAVAAVCV